MIKRRTKSEPAGLRIARIREPRPGSIGALMLELGHAIARASAIREKEKQDRAVTRTCRIGRRLLSAPAKSLDDMLTKIMVAAYFADCTPPAKGGVFQFQSNWKPGREATEELLALASLRGDIQRLQRGRIAR